MKREDLANEIRGAGHALRYADGPVTITTFLGDRVDSLHSPVNKLKTPDSKIILMASTCSECDAVASKIDRTLAEEWADCYQSFARLIWPCINHEEECTAEPYIPVSESASKRFQKIKAKFDAKRKAWAEKKAKMTPEELEAHRSTRQKVREEKEKKYWAAVLSSAKKALQDQAKQATRKSTTKKAKPATKNKKAKKKPAKKKPSKKKPAGKKTTKRKNR
jgi:hypothetical protein